MPITMGARKRWSASARFIRMESPAEERGSPSTMARSTWRSTTRSSSIPLAVTADGAVFAVVHGRDQLSENWPKLYTVEQQNELPAEILARITEGADFGWPSCYFDAMQAKQVLGPEYGGDGGKAVGECAMKGRPDM